MLASEATRNNYSTCEAAASKSPMRLCFLCETQIERHTVSYLNIFEAALQEASQILSENITSMFLTEVYQTTLHTQEQANKGIQQENSHHLCSAF